MKNMNPMNRHKTVIHWIGLGKLKFLILFKRCLAILTGSPDKIEIL